MTEQAELFVQVKLTEKDVPGACYVALECHWNTTENIASVSEPVIKWNSRKTIKRTTLLRSLPEYSCLRPRILIPS